MWTGWYRSWLAAALACAAGVPAYAADMPVKAPPPAAQGGGSFWAEASYLYWSAKGDRLPALVTQGGTGVLGAPGTVVAFGDNEVNDRWQSGARLRGGYWFDPSRRSGIEAHAFFLRSGTDFNASSDGTTVLAQPFFNAFINVQDALLIGSPGAQIRGQVAVTDTSRLFGTGGAYRTELCAVCAIGSVSGVAGYRYLYLRDALTITSASLITGGVNAGTSIGLTDAFATRNQFHGLDLGLTGEARRGPWSLEWLAKVAIGATFSDLSVNGSSSTTAGGVTVITPGGLLAQPTNMGEFNRTRLATVPELAAKLAYQVTPAIRIFAGYDVMYWTGVIRPGGAIDTAVNPTQFNGGVLVGAARPAPRFDTSDYWVHGISFGIRAGF